MGAHAVILGPSGVGKTSLMRELAGTTGVKGYDFTLDLPRTTRQRRLGEGDGEYVFLDRESFDRLRPELLFTMKTYGDYEFGLVKPAPLMPKEVRMRALLPANALKFREMVEAPVLFCMIKPLQEWDVRKLVLERNGGIEPADFMARVGVIEEELRADEEIADIVFNNVAGVETAAARLRQTIENYCIERGY